MDGVAHGRVAIVRYLRTVHDVEYQARAADRCSHDQWPQFIYIEFADQIYEV